MLRHFRSRIFSLALFRRKMTVIGIKIQQKMPETYPIIMKTAPKHIVRKGFQWVSGCDKIWILSSVEVE